MSRRLWWRIVVGAVAMAGALAWPTAGAAQTVVGNAKAVKATKFGLFGGTTTTLAGTGALGGPGDCLDATGVTGSVSSLLSGEVLRAVTTAWTDQVASEASLASLGITVAGTGITADFVQASAVAVQGEAGTASCLISNLSINGVPIDVTGAPNQTIAIPGGRVVINEQRISAASTTVNALHAVVTGVADIVVASATAGIQ
jgi:hypothetical protein